MLRGMRERDGARDGHFGVLMHCFACLHCTA